MTSRARDTRVLVRRATKSDARTIWEWANDPETRAASLDSSPIPWASHVAWLYARIAHEAHLILIGETTDGRAVGLVRFDTQDGWRSARLSYSIAPEHRGQGFAKPLLDAGVASVRSQFGEVLIRAEVSPVNERSLRAFKGLPGWVDATAPGSELVIFEYR